MTKNEFGWKVGDLLRWSSPEGRDLRGRVTKATAIMIEFETEEGDSKRVKGDNPAITRIDDPPAGGGSLPKAGSEAEANAYEADADIDDLADGEDEVEPDESVESAPVDDPDFGSKERGEKVSEMMAEVDLVCGGVDEISVLVKKGGGPRAGDEEFRLPDGERWHPSLEAALDAEYGRSWMCIRMQER
jgi:hypothetical protein